MKPAFIITLIVLALSSSALASDQAKLDEFKATVEAALKAKDTPSLHRFFYTEGADSYQLDSTVWAHFEADHDGYTFDRIDFTPVDDPSFPEAARKRLQGTTMNGHLYVPNLKPAYTCALVYKGTSGSGILSNLLLGFDPDGNPKFILDKPATSTRTQP